MTATSWHSRAGAAIVGGVYNEIVAYLTPIIVKKIWFTRRFGFEEIMHTFRVSTISCFQKINYRYTVFLSVLTFLNIIFYAEVV